MEIALEILKETPPDVFNHNLETVPRLYKQARPGADYQHSLNLLREFKKYHPQVPTKSGLMVGLGEEDAEILAEQLQLLNNDALELINKFEDKIKPDQVNQDGDIALIWACCNSMNDVALLMINKFGDKVKPNHVNKNGIIMN